MAFEEIMAKVQAWATATEALAALGAKLEIQHRGLAAPPVIVSALDDITVAAGLDELDALTPQQRSTVVSLARLAARQMVDVLVEPDREPGWTFTDPDILDGWGRGSAMLPAMIAAAHPALADISSFLDVGTGVGLLACAAASVWPRASIVGIDPWGPSLERARTNVEGAGLRKRIELRQQRVRDLDEVAAYDCAWLPTFFLTEDDLEASLPAVVRAVKPGGWVVLGRMRSAPDPLVAAAVRLRVIRAGGFDLDPKRAAELLESAGCAVGEPAAMPPMSPVELVLGRTPA